MNRSTLVKRRKLLYRYSVVLSVLFCAASLETRLFAQTPALDVTLVLVDADSGELIPEFQVVPASYRDYDAPTWQYQYSQTLSEKENLFTMERGWPLMQLRISAEGFATQLSEPLERGKPVTLKIKMKKDPGIRGVVHTPEGLPAEGATVALCTKTKAVTVRNGILRTTKRAGSQAKLFTTDDEGNFRVPSEPSEWVLVFSHKSGFAEPTQAELEVSSVVELKPWGHLKGVVKIGEDPISGMALSIGTGRGDVDVDLQYSAETTTEQDGSYAFDKLPPRQLYVSPTFTSGNESYSPFSMSRLVEVKPGQETIANIFDRGQRVHGKVALPTELGLGLADVSISINCFLRPPSVSGLAIQVRKDFDSYSGFLKSDYGKAFQRQDIQVQLDGTFAIMDLPSAEYVIQIRAQRKGDPPEARPLAFAARRIKVKSATVKKSALDLGEFGLRSN